jgi:lipopolysaccharide export system ATP-binding protein
LTPALEAVSLHKSFGRRTVINNVSLTVPPGRIIGLLGPNGAGKTTIFKIILGLTPPDKGEISFGRRLDGLPMFRRCLLGLGYLPQGPSVFRGLSVKNNLLAVLEERRAENPEKRAEALLQRFELADFADQKASLLSGGERRKLEFARALCAEPKILLLDEPFAGVDPIAAEKIARAVRELAADGIGLLVTDHNVRGALSVCDTVHILADGRIAASGTAKDIVQSDIAKRLYLGETFS